MWWPVRALDGWSRRLASSRGVWVGMVGLVCVESVLVMRGTQHSLQVHSAWEQSRQEPMCELGCTDWIDLYGVRNHLDPASIARVKGAFIAYLQDVQNTRFKQKEGVVDAVTAQDQEAAAGLHLRLALENLVHQGAAAELQLLALERVPQAGRAGGSR